MERNVTIEKHMAAMAANLPKHTGRTLDEWIALMKQEGPPTDKERQQWLQGAHGLGRDQALTVVYLSSLRDGYVPPTADELLQGQYAGAKAALRPLYDRIAAAAGALGPDVSVEPRKTATSIFRARQFAVVVPATTSRIDLFLALPDGFPATQRLVVAARPQGRCNYLVALNVPGQVDDELAGWLHVAYEAGQ